MYSRLLTVTTSRSDRLKKFGLGFARTDKARKLWRGRVHALRRRPTADDTSAHRATPLVHCRWAAAAHTPDHISVGVAGSRSRGL